MLFSLTHVKPQTLRLRDACYNNLKHTMELLCATQRLLRLCIKFMEALANYQCGIQIMIGYFSLYNCGKTVQNYAKVTLFRQAMFIHTIINKAAHVLNQF